MVEHTCICMLKSIDAGPEQISMQNCTQCKVITVAVAKLIVNRQRRMRYKHKVEVASGGQLQHLAR